MIKCKETKLGKLELGIRKRDIFGERYDKYNDKVYEEKYLRRDCMTKYKRKASD